MRLVYVLLFIFSFVGCATATPYQAQSGKDEYGYQDLKIDDNKYRIVFRGNSVTSRETVETYLLYRAAELTLENKFDYFVVREQQVDVKSDYFANGPMYGMYGGMGRRRYPYYAMGYSWSGPSTVSSQDRYRAIAYIAMFKGKVPDGKEDAYNAHEVLKNLEPNITRPKIKDSKK